MGAEVASDSNALLGMEGLSDSTVDNVFTNNSPYAMDITLDAAPYEDESKIRWDINDPVTDSDNDNNPVTFSLSAGANADVAVKGDDKVTFDGTALLKDGEATVGRIEVTRTINVPVINNLELSGSVSSAGNSGKLTFTLENTGDVDVELRKIGIIETTTTAEYVSGGGSLFNANDGTEYVTDWIPIDNNTSDSTQREMTPKPVLDHQSDGDTDSMSITFEFNKFRDPDSRPANVDMRGEDVKIELTVKNLENGSIVGAPVDLCNGRCNF
ncbi:hypothetical protein [Natrinema altunense]|nr:hypothetical protein [Natrinema altunense]